MKYEKIVEQTVAIKPSEEYKGRVTREQAERTLLGYHVTAFRPPLHGESYLGKTNKIVIRGVNDNYTFHGPRLIVVPNPSYNNYWE